MRAEKGGRRRIRIKQENIDRLSEWVVDRITVTEILQKKNSLDRNRIVRQENKSPCMAK